MSVKKERKERKKSRESEIAAKRPAVAKAMAGKLQIYADSPAVKKAQPRKAAKQ